MAPAIETVALPVFEIIAAGTQAAIRFAKTYPRLLLFSAVIYAISAFAQAFLIPEIQRTGWLGPHLMIWGLSLPQVVLLAPVWTVLNRFIILGERDRGYFTMDFRLRRVLLVLLVLSFISMLGGAPFAFAIDFIPHVARRNIVRAILAGAAVGKLLCWWLAIRLAIAPAMAAAGTRKRPLDTSFAYTGGSLWRLVGVKLIIYMPLFGLAGVLTLTGRLGGPGQSALVSPPVITVLVTIVTACTELVDAAAMARAATILAGRKAAAAKAAAAKAAA